ncbi:hypothetical protein PLICRDRAFT_39631 [Plicaturopsis crispa FD-325 SS-3]|nr:hypothetical protein PLICRDRAFT_39631 [Plicaturopsis crispa FD-325 SS-3]
MPSISTIHASGSVASFSTTTSTTPLRPSVPEKDYAPALGHPQTTRRMNGAAPVLPPSAHSSASKTKAARPTEVYPVFPASYSPPVKKEKDYEAAFAQLSSSYGWGSAVPPALPPKQKKAPKVSKSKSLSLTQRLFGKS